jgi:hypothetical protein
MPRKPPPQPEAAPDAPDAEIPEYLRPAPLSRSQRRALRRATARTADQPYQRLRAAFIDAGWTPPAPRPAPSPPPPPLTSPVIPFIDLSED